jgi:subtilisin family serine protease
MPKNIFLIFIILLLVSCGGDVPPKSSPSVYKEGEILVKFKSGVHETQRQTAHNATGAKSIRKLPIEGLERIKLHQNISVEEAINVYKANPDVEYAEPNYIVKASVIPDDTKFGEQWGLHNTGQTVNGTNGSPDADIDAPEAWDIVQSSSDIIVAVIDSGIDKNHPDLSGNLIAGYDFIDYDNDPDDLNGHGTHVAGIIGAVGNNSRGVSGVGWAVKIMPLKVLDNNGEGAISDIIEAVTYADSHNAKIVNMSFSASAYPQSLYDSMASYPDILFVAAAGNSGSIVPEYPAGFDLSNIISVTATDQNDSLAYFSNYGSTVSVAAPGTNILSTIPSFTTGVTYSGTYKVVYLSFGFESINGADSRNAVMQKVLNFNSVTQSDKILLVDDDGGDSYENYYIASLQGYTFDVYTVPSGSNGPFFSTLNQYKLVIWFTGREFGDLIPITLTAFDQISLQAYLYSGGRLFLTGQEIGYEIGSTSFYKDYLHAIYVTDDAIGTVYTGLNTFGDLFIDTSPGTGDGAYYTRYVDAIKPLGSMPAFFIDYNDAYQFLDVTSMATPMVSGIAALVASYYGNFSADQIKGAILNSIDAKSSLQEKILTGGRVNAYKALTSLIPPSNLNATVQSETKILLTWTDNSSNESGFKIERKTGVSGVFAEIATVAANVTTYLDTGLLANTTYIYRIRAYDSTGYSSYSDEAVATTPTPDVIPDAPNNFVAVTISSSQIDLNWTDNSTNESGFRIERSLSESGPWTQIVVKGSDITSHSDTGLSASTTYYYRVYAYNTAGNSAYSNTASATTSEKQSAGSGGGGGGGGCSIGTVHNVQTAMADTAILFMPLVAVWIIRRFRKH